MSNIVISGADGFIGKHLALKLSKSKKYKLVKMGKRLGDISQKKNMGKIAKGQNFNSFGSKDICARFLE